MNACANPPDQPLGLYDDSYCAGSHRQRWNHGHLLAYYTGHGSNTVWANERLFYAR